MNSPRSARPARAAAARQRRRPARPLRHLAAAAVPLALAAAVLAAPAASAQPLSSPAPATARPAAGPPAATAGGNPATAGGNLAAPLAGLHGAAHTVVTLITGDRVSLTAAGRGRYAVSASPVPRPDGRTPSVQVAELAGPAGGGSVYAVPGDAAPLITAGRVDRQLFSIARLVAHGDTGTASATLPLIVQFTGHLSPAALARRAAALPGATRTATLAGSNAAAVSVSIRHAGAFWAALTGATATAATAGGPGLAPGIARVWLAGDQPPAPETGSRPQPGQSLSTLTVTIDARAGSALCNPGFLICLSSIFSLVGVAGGGEGQSYRPTGYSCADGTSPCDAAQFTYSVPAGIYMFDVWDRLITKSSPNVSQTVMLLDPQVTVAGDTGIAFDLSDARQITIATPLPTATSARAYQGVFGFQRTLVNGVTLAILQFVAYGFSSFWVAPPASPEPVTVGSFHFASQWVLEAPPVTMTVAKPRPLALHPIYPLPDRYPLWDGLRSGGIYQGAVDFSGVHTLPLVWANYGSKQDLAGLDVKGKLIMVRLHPYVGNLLTTVLTNALQAGAAGILVDPIMPVGALNGNSIIPRQQQGYDRTEPPGIPFVDVTSADARALLGLLRRGPVDITVADSGPSPYVYRLAFYHEGEIPSSLSVHYTVTARQLAAIGDSVHAAQPGPMGVDWVSWRPDESFVADEGYDLGAAAPTSIREYVGPVSPSLVYLRKVQPGGQTYHPAVNEYDVFGVRGSRGTENWGESPAAPGAVTPSPGVQAAQAPGTFGFRSVVWCSGCRQGDIFWPQMLVNNPAAGQSREVAGFGDVTFRLYHDGKQIPATDSYFFPAYQLPARQAEYRLTLDHTPAQGGGLGSSETVHTAWDFRSAAPATDQTPAGTTCLGNFLGVSGPCQAEPLIFLRYDAGVNMANAVTAPGTHQLQVTAYHQAPGAPAVTALTVWTSTSGGASWQRALVIPRGHGSYTAVYTVPRLAGTSATVSLKVQASDAAGNDVTQVIDNAYNLTARHR